MRRTLLLLLLVLSPLSVAHAGWRDRENTVATVSVDLPHDGKTRRYVLYIPPTPNRAHPAPLVLAFHGGGGHAEMMADDERYGLIRAAQQNGFIVAFPNGFSRLPRGRLATWNAGGCCGSARDSGSDDVGFSRAVVADIARKLAVDRQRIFAIGMSNGGMMAYRLACEAADLFRAVAAVAGTEALAHCHPVRPISILHIHAQNDDHVLFNGGAGPAAFRDADKVMNFVSVPETIQRWTKRNGCQLPLQRTLTRPDAWCDTYTGCREGTQVQLCVTADGGHSWPGARVVRRGKEDASQALDANETIWRFFSGTGRR